jgi:beta-galactosidase
MPSTDRFLLSGEFHYFRVPRSSWKDRLHQVKDLGFEAVSIYIPWNWHEQNPGALDFTGKTLPERNLIGALNDIAGSGLGCIFRPGPFITAEWRDGGLPNWLWELHPEIQCLNAGGKPSGYRRPYPAITYLHPYYLQASKTWLENVFGAVQGYFRSQGGPIFHVQLDDEPSYWHQLAHPLLADYNPFLVNPIDGPSHYSQWLLKKYGSLDMLNAGYGTSYRTPEEIDAPRMEMQNREELQRYSDWLDYKLWMIAEYTRSLYDVTRAAGVTETLSMLYPYLLPLQAGKYTQMIDKDNLPLEMTNEVYLNLFGSGVVPEQKYGHVAFAHEYYHMWRGQNHGPAVTMEVQGSNASYITPGSMEALYDITLSKGIKGFNVYMLVGGNNPPGYENLTGQEYDVCAPISPEGDLRPHSAVHGKLIRIIHASEPEILSAQPLRDAWWGCYSPYETASLVGGTSAMMDAGAALAKIINCGEHGISSETTLQALMVLSNISLGCLDLERASDEEWAKVQQLWVFSLDFMSAAVQKRLVQYVQNGGSLVILPVVPTQNERMQTCTLLAEQIFSGSSIPSFEGLFPETPLFVSQVNGMQGESLVAPGKPTLFDPLPPDAQALALDVTSGKPCAFERPVGRGKVTVIGFPLVYLHSASVFQKEFISRVVEQTTHQRKCWTDNPQLLSMEMAGAESGFLSLINPVHLPATARVHYTQPRTGSQAVIPLVLQGITLADEGALLLPVDLPLNNTLSLHHSTWELIGFEHGNNSGVLTFAARSNQPGEIALSGSIQGIVLEGAVVESTTPIEPDITVLVLRPDREEVILKLGR